MVVTTTEVREWLNKQIDAYKVGLTRLMIDEEKDLVLHNIGVQDNGIHLQSEVVRYVADKLELDLCVKSRCQGNYPYEVFFIYKGVVFFDIESEEEYRTFGAVV